ncbi:MAG: transglutaminase family protein [Terricaulis sp.]
MEPYAETFPFAYEAALKSDLAPYLKTTKPGPLLKEYLAEIPTQGATVNFLVDLNQRLSQHVSYLIRMAPGVQTPEETLSMRSGSCRDSSWLLVQIARNLGLAARFVSGYLVQLKPDLKALDGPSGTEVDFTDLHAWAEIYLPGAGWIGFDPTSGLLCGEGHIPLAATPNFGTAAPISGAAGRGERQFHLRNEREASA